MTYPAGHYLIAFGGGLPGGEQWQMSLRQQGGSLNTDQALDQAQCDVVADAIAAWFGTAAGSYFPASTLAWVKRNHIGMDGRYVNGYTALTEMDPPLAGTGTVRLPNQCAVAVTLTTGISRGLASKGRIFFPAIALSITSEGVLAPAARDGISTVVKDLIDRINALPLGGARVAIVSGTRAGASRVVTAVETGVVVDTMRSRRSSLDEARVPLAVAEPVPSP